jgi:hypothetical protein
MKVHLVLSFTLGLSACCMGGAVPTAAPSVAPSAPAIAAPAVGSAPYAVAPGVPTWSESYGTGFLSDGTPSYWCTAMGPAFPISATLNLAAPTALAAIDFDTRMSGYETSAINDVTIEVLGAGGVTVGTQRVGLNQNNVTSVPLALGTATAVRLTMHGNFGGSYAGLAEVTLRTIPGAGMPPLASPGARGRGLAYTIAPGIPTWSDSYAASNMQDGNPATYWCTAMGPTFPFVFSLSFPAPATVSALRFDTRLPSYDTSGLRDVTLEALGPNGEVISATNQVLGQNVETTVTLPAPTLMSGIRVTARSNHGGSYAGLSELTVDGVGLPAL